MSVSYLTTESVRSLSDLGGLAEQGALPSLPEQLDALRGRRADDPQLVAFFRIAESFSLDEAEQLLLANCLWRTMEGRAFQSA
ncbi:MAG: hypothetical protein RRY21_06775, partial [Oscillospiraceae bacterium]